MKKINPIIIILLRAFFLCLIFITMSAITFGAIQGGTENREVLGFWSEIRYNRVSFVYSLLIFFSYSEIFSLNDYGMKMRFYEKDADSEGKLEFIFKRSGFPLSFAAVVAMTAFVSFVFPGIYPMSALINGFLHGYDLSALSKKIIALAILIVIIFIIMFFAHLSAVSWWAGQGQGKRNEKKSVLRFILKIYLMAVLWAIGASVLIIVYPMFSTTLTIISVVWRPLLAVALVIIAVFLIFVYGRVISQRRQLMLKVKRICKIKGYAFKTNGSFISSILTYRKKYDFSVETAKKRYLCKIETVPQRRSPVFLNENGTIRYIKDRIIFKHHVTDTYTFEAEKGEGKVLIFCPFPVYLYAEDERSQRTIESGDVMMEYRVYRPLEFTASLDRELI